MKHLLWESELRISKAVALFRNIIVVDHIVSMETAAGDPCDQCDLDSDSSIGSESEDES